MKIDSVQIINFRCHKHLDINLSNYHVLVGENGTGKTAILEAINYACSPYFIQSRITEQDFNNENDADIKILVTFDKYFILKIPDGFADQHIPCKAVQLKVKRREMASAGKALSEPYVTESICVPIEYDDVSQLNSDFLPEGMATAILSPAVRNIEEKDKSGISITKKNGKIRKVRKNLLSLNVNETVGYPNVFYFNRQREKESKIGFNSLFAKITKELNWRYRKTAKEPLIAEYWEKYYSCIMECVDKRVRMELIGPAIKRASKIIGISPDDIELSILNVEEPFNKGFLSKRDGLKQIPLEGFGSGISMLLTLFLLEHFGKLSKGESIFLIDEPEMHMHPQYQRKLLDHFVQSANQTIISSHSPLFIDLGKWEGISRLSTNFQISPSTEILDKMLGYQDIRSHLNDIAKWRKNKTVFVDNDPEILFARNVLLVEGPAEKYGFPILSRLLGCEFKDCTIISCNGKNKQ